MPKELFEINHFNQGTITNPGQADIPPNAASSSLDLDPIAEDGKLVGIPGDTKIEDSVGDDVNILLNNVTDPTKHDLIYYKNSNNTIYKAEDIYGGSATEGSLGTITSSGDDVSMEAMNGAVYVGAGSGDNDNPYWVGRMDHKQWGVDATNALVAEEDSLLPPNYINEATNACSDGQYIYMVYAGLNGTNGSESVPSETDEHSTSRDYKYAAGEITKVRLSDGSVIKRSNKAYGYINAICLSSDETKLWIITSKKYPVSKNTTETTTNEHKIYLLNADDLKVIETYTTNLDTLIRATLFSSDYGNWEATNVVWGSGTSLWDGSSMAYQGAFSDIIEVKNSEGNRVLWVCTTAGAVFNTYGTDITSGTSLTFANRTPKGLGFYNETDVYTDSYIGPTTSVPVGSFYTSGTSWRIPEFHCGSFLQLNDTNNIIGIALKNGELSDTINYVASDGDKNITGRSIVVMISQAHEEHSKISGILAKDTEAHSGSKLLLLNDSSIISSIGLRKTQNMLYKGPVDSTDDLSGTPRSAYSYVDTHTSSTEKWNIAEFDNPSSTATDGGNITVAEVEATDTSLIPLRISDTEVIGIPSDAYNAVGNWNLNILTVRNNSRALRKYTYDSSWTGSVLGNMIYLSQRAFLVQETDESSNFHTSGFSYFYRFSFVYDGYQESPLGAAKMIISSGKTVKLRFLFTTDNFPQRVTGLRIYRASSVSAVDSEIGGFYHFLKEIDVSTYSSYDKFQSPSGSGDDDFTYLDEGNEILVSSQRPIEVEDTGSVGATYEVMSGLFESMTDSNVKYRLSTQLNNSLFIAHCNHHSQEVSGANIIYKSLPYKPSVINWAVDFLRLPEVPVAIQAFNGRIYAFSEHNTYKIEPNTFFIEDVFEGAGCIGPDAVAVSDYGMCYCDHNNIYLHNGQQPFAIGDMILTGNSSEGYLDLLNTSSFIPRVIFEAKRKCFIVYTTSNRAWAYNVPRKIWNFWTAAVSGGVFNGKKGEVLYAKTSDGHLYHALSSGTKNNWIWTSKKLGMNQDSQKKRWYETNIGYEGAAPTVAIRWDYDGSDDTAKADDTSVSNQIKTTLNNASNKKLLRLKLTSNSNTSKVDSIGITFRRFFKLIDQG